MQVKKEELRLSILHNAKLEFLKFGYQKASLRNIAKASGITHSNIYNYFKNKNEIFKEIFKPLLVQIEKGKQMLALHNHDENENRHWSLEDHYPIVDAIVYFVDTHRELLELLVFKSNGSSLENFVNDLTDWYTDTIGKMFSIIVKKHKNKNHKFGHLFIHTVSGTWVNFAVESLMHNIKGEELRTAGYNLMKFMYAGWQGVMGVHVL